MHDERATALRTAHATERSFAPRVDPGITAALAVAILSLLFSFRALAARRARLSLARRPLAARQVAHRRPALFLSRQAALRQKPRKAAERDARALPVAARQRDLHAIPRSPAVAYRIAPFQVLCRDPAAEHSREHPRPDLDSRPTVALAAGHVLPVAVSCGSQMAESVAQRVCLAAFRVQAAAEHRVLA